MTNPTSNFGWQMPTSTDLVTDLPADFEVFGQAVDTSLADLKGGTSGQILAKNSNTDMDFTWITNDVGDITAVTAGTGISGGGTSGAVTITNSMATEITASGDIIVGTGAGTFDNLPIGTTGQVLTADTTVSPYKVKWASASSTPNYIGVCAVGNSTGLSVTANTQHTVPFPQADQWDTNSFHDITTNNTRITIPTGYGGKYLITAQIQNALVCNYAYLIFMKNGSNTGAPSGPPGAFYGRVQNNGSNTYGLSSTIVLSLAAGDYIEVGFQSDQTTTMIYDGRFTATYLGA